MEEARWEDWTMKGACILLAATAVIGSAAPSVADPDYPPGCGTRDLCAAVVAVGWEGADGRAPELLLSSAHGRAALRGPFPVLAAGDGRLHVCLRHDPFGDPEVTCLLVPARRW
jgi:hypothetical protein